MVEVYGFVWHRRVCTRRGDCSWEKRLGLTRVCCRRVRDGYGRRDSTRGVDWDRRCAPGVLDRRAEYLIVALVASLCTFFFWPKLLSKEVRESKAMETAVNWLDALSLGGFCIIGANAALVRNLGPLLAVALSICHLYWRRVTRDVFLRQPVRVLHSNAELYGTTAIAGAVVYALFVCQFPGVSHDVRCSLSASTVVFLRWRAWKQGLKLPCTQT